MDIQSMKVQKQFAKPEVTEKQLRSVCAERSCFRFVQFLRIVPPCQRLPYEESWHAKWDREVQRCCFWMTSWMLGGTSPCASFSSLLMRRSSSVRR